VFTGELRKSGVEASLGVNCQRGIKRVVIFGFRCKLNYGTMVTYPFFNSKSFKHGVSP
jgi:hypothetical protein